MISKNLFLEYSLELSFKGFSILQNIHFFMKFLILEMR